MIVLVNNMRKYLRECIDGIGNRIAICLIRLIKGA